MSAKPISCRSLAALRVRQDIRLLKVANGVVSTSNKSTGITIAVGALLQCCPHYFNCACKYKTELSKIIVICCLFSAKLQCHVDYAQHCVSCRHLIRPTKNAVSKCLAALIFRSENNFNFCFILFPKIICVLTSMICNIQLTHRQCTT